MDGHPNPVGKRSVLGAHPWDNLPRLQPRSHTPRARPKKPLSPLSSLLLLLIQPFSASLPLSLPPASAPAAQPQPLSLGPQPLNPARKRAMKSGLRSLIREASTGDTAMFQFKLIDPDRTWEISEEEFAEHISEEQLAKMKHQARLNALIDIDCFGYVDLFDLRVIYIA